MQWSKLELVVFAARAQTADAIVYLPSGQALQRLSLTRKGGRFMLSDDPLRGSVTWSIRSYADARRQ